jgi:DNA-binding MarR family transcriptional regulator
MLEDEPKGVALKDLAKRMQMTVPAASLMVDSMVSKGFMERNTNPADRRAICIKLTEKGMKLFNEVYAHFHEEIDRRAKALTADEMQTLAGVVEKLQHG